MERELLAQVEQVVWVSDLRYVTTVAPDREILQQLSESGEQQEWYAYPMVDDAPGLDIRVYAVHDNPLMALNEAIPLVTRWIQRHGIEATLGEIHVRSEQAVNDEIKQLIEGLRSRNHSPRLARSRS